MEEGREGGKAVFSCLVCDLGSNLLIKARVGRGQEINLVTALCSRLLRMVWKGGM